MNSIKKYNSFLSKTSLRRLLWQFYFEGCGFENFELWIKVKERLSV